MARLLSEDGPAALDGRRVIVLCPDPFGALDVAERLERAGAEVLAAFDLHQLSTALQRGFPDGVVAELSDTHRWISIAVALLHEFAVPQVLGATERERSLLRSKLPRAAFLPAPLSPGDAVLSLGVLLGSHWSRLLRGRGSRRSDAASARPAVGISLVADQRGTQRG